ncbi:NADPH-dependent diflavin oxidoreductase 1 [Tetranychus urticae]|uniref:NADPH-dependent diflavin oxidoreductase 1 n=1 Tax=Tetranychus urticae TaxID=32264 RepID=T1K2J0_TETUR|nr:NADPH-dependent diflavin oxidoreductase 1 [Tetranychus urticae]
MVNQLLILYAGETGNSEDVARMVYRAAKKLGLQSKAMSISDYQMSQLIDETLVLFICSTTGQGNEPTPLKRFWTLIMRKNLPNDCLSHLNAAVIGLGDSSYMLYNVVGKKLFKRLQSLGAKMILDLALGDDQHDLGLWASVTPWLQEFWDKVKQLVPLTKGLNPDDIIFEPSYQVDVLGCNEYKPDIPKPQVNSGSIICNERVTPSSHFQEVRFIKICINNEPDLIYQPGDVVLIHPKNFPDEVAIFCSLLNLNPSMKFRCRQLDMNFTEYGHNNLPEFLDVHTLVTQQLDIHSVPKRSFFDLLWRFSEDDLEREKLREFASTEGQQELYNYCHKPKRNILEVLQDFPHTASKIPLNYLFDLIPGIRPRAFSIASSMKMYPNEIHLLVAVVKFKTKLRSPRTGLCSNYLAQLVKGDSINLTIRRGEFKIPHSDPLIMVGPGTGVAPFRSIIQERFMDKIPDNVLFFGCRFSNADYYFKDEWEEYQSKSHLQVFTAFSRDNPAKKWYVQDEMLANRSIIEDFIIKRGSTLLIAGSSNQMPDDVRNCVKKIIIDCNNQIGEDEAEKLVCKLEACRKIQYECWS